MDMDDFGANASVFALDQPPGIHDGNTDSGEEPNIDLCNEEEGPEDRAPANKRPRTTANGKGKARCAQSELISTITASAEKEKEIAKEEREVERQERALDRAAEASRHQRQMEVQEMEIKLRREEMQARSAQEARNHELMMKVLGSVLPGINPST